MSLCGSHSALDSNYKHWKVQVRMLRKDFSIERFKHDHTQPNTASLMTEMKQAWNFEPEMKEEHMLSSK